MKTMQCSLFAMALLAACALSRPAFSQTPAQSPSGAAIKVAIADPVKIFNAIKETEDLKQQMENSQKNLTALGNEKQAKINAAKDQRDQLKPEAPQWNDRNKDYIQLNIELQVWAQMQKENIARQQKQQTKTIYDKIVATTSEVAQKKGIDLVIANQQPDINIDQVDINQLRILISEQNVLYNTASLDITNDIVAEMDAKYKAGK
jgi:Skp family chaperone for outer membrane proteins